MQQEPVSLCRVFNNVIVSRYFMLAIVINELGNSVFNTS